MTLTVTEYRHDDVGAPTLDGGVGSLIEVLKACLVDGYGDKTPAGWTKPLSDIGRAAFVNNTTDGGTGCYVYVDDNAPSAEGARAASIRTYTTMTDIDTGDYGTNPVWCRKSATLDSTARPWVLWADGLTFWLYVLDSGDSQSFWQNLQFCGAGDYDCLDADNAFRFFALGRETGASDGDQEFVYSRDNIGHGGFEVVHLDGVTGPVTGTVKYRGSAALNTSGNCADYAADPATVGGAFLARTDIFIVDTAMLGSLRGVASPMHRLQGNYTNGEEIGTTGYVLTLVVYDAIAASQTHRLGSLPVDRNGPW